jgi:hypothetical protein
MNYGSTLPRFQSPPKALSAYFHPLSDNALRQSLGAAGANEHNEFIGPKRTAPCVDLDTLQPYDAAADEAILFLLNPWCMPVSREPVGD